MIPLECLRLGLRGDTFFQFMPKDIEERLRQVNSDEVDEEETEE
jgi:phosphosulfolactate synthase